MCPFSFLVVIFFICYSFLLGSRRCLFTGLILAVNLHDYDDCFATFVLQLQERVNRRVVCTPWAGCCVRYVCIQPFYATEKNTIQCIQMWESCSMIVWY